MAGNREISAETPSYSPSAAISHDGDWRRSLAQAIRDPAELLSLLDLPMGLLPSAKNAAEAFPLLVPQSYLRRMRRGDPLDPLLRQVLPLADELSPQSESALDPVGDSNARVAPGLLHKYRGRALLIATGTCAIHCRYCFRRHYPYEDEPRRLDDWQPAFDALARDESLHEVILSGGDPLILSDARLAAFVERLETIPHLKRLRIHSRLPIVLPDRVTAGLIDLLLSSRLQPVMVVHANHDREIAGDCSMALRRLVRSGVPTLNQAVLLRGVNDDVTSLHRLCESLGNIGVIPYYLHQLDRVRGAAHFEVPEDHGRQLVETLRALLPGYLVPTYVRETAGQSSKTLVP
jgi:L-lysine 2,3-aminomutase